MRRSGVACLLAAVGVLCGVIQGADKPARLDGVSVRLEPFEPFPYVEPGAQGKVSYRLTNQTDRELQIAWKVTIELPKRPEQALAEKFVLKPGGEHRLAMPDAVAAVRGVVGFAWEITDQDGRKLALRDTLGVMTLPGPEKSHREDFRFGWGTSLVHFVDSVHEAQCMKAYAQMGCDLLRVGDRWAYTSERDGPDVVFKAANSKVDEIVTAAVQQQIDVLYVMWGTPPHRVRKDFSNKDKIASMAKETRTDLPLMVRVCPPDLDAWRKRVQATVSHFKDRVRYWEVWNDQDRYHDNGQHMPNGWVGSTDEYLELLRVTHQQIKAIDPELQVLTGGFFTAADDPRHKLNPDMQRRVIAEAQDAFDIHATFDTSPAVLLGPMAELRAQLKSPKPLWITRVEQRGAKPDELVRRLVSAKGCGAKSFVWMWGLNFDSGYRGMFMPMATWKDKDRKPINQHSVFQMMPAGCAYVHAIGLLRMLRPAGRVDTGHKDEWIFCFADSAGPAKRQVLAFWKAGKGEARTHALKVGAGASCMLLDLYGNPQSVTPEKDGTLSIHLAQEPVYLVIEKGSAVAAGAGEQ